MRSDKSLAPTRPARASALRLRLSEVATLVRGQLVGDDDPWITGLAGIQDAGEGDLTFLAQRRYRAALAESRAAAVLVDRRQNVDRPAVRVEDPAVAFNQVLRRFSEATRRVFARGVHPTAVVDANARLGADVALGPHVVVESGAEIGDRCTVLAGSVIGKDVRLGDDCIVYPNVTVYEATEIGARVILHAGSVIGSDGFGYVPEEDHLAKVPHLGSVVIEDDVEIGANTCIDRATTGVTRIGRGTKIDNLVQVAHNVRIGASSVLCAQVGVSGSAQIGNGVKIGGQAGIIGHIQIGDGVVVGAQSGVIGALSPGCTVSGYPARPHVQELRQRVWLTRLPELLQAVRDLRARLARVENHATEEPDA